MSEFLLVGGHAALDLANTVAPRLPGGEGVEIEYLDSAASLLTWARRADVISGAEAEGLRRAWAQDPSIADAALADVLAVRSLVEPALGGQDMDRVVTRWTAAIGRSALTPARGAAAGRAAPSPAGPGHFATLTVGGDPAWLIGDRLADALVDLLRTADPKRLRECPVPEGGCGWLFLDRSRNNTRRWCAMQDCGTHAKSKRLTERRRARRS